LDIGLRISKFNLFDVFDENTPEIEVWQPGGKYFCFGMAQEGCRAIYPWEMMIFDVFLIFHLAALVYRNFLSPFVYGSSNNS
jgi:hypothetical protein